MIYIDPNNLFYICGCFIGSLCTLCICKNRKLLPHISEQRHIGKFYRFFNIHKYETFNITLEIHHVNLKFSDDEKSKFIIHLKIGNRYAYTHFYKQHNNKIYIEERKNMTVKQNNSVLIIEVYKKGTLKNTLFGRTEIPIYNEIIKKLFPCNSFFNILNKNQIVATICLSFYYIDLSCVRKDDQIYSSLFIETIINVQKKKNKNHKKIKQMLEEGTDHFDIIKKLDVSKNIYRNISSLAIVDKIRIFSRNLNGYLLYTNYYIKRIYYNYYFHLHFFKGKFYWCFYNDEKDAQEDRNRVDYVKLENVLNVYSDAYNHRYFYVKYTRKYEKAPSYLYLKSVDRDRNIWVNVIHDFIILINNYKKEKKLNKHLKNEQEKAKDNQYPNKTHNNNNRNQIMDIDNNTNNRNHYVPDPNFPMELNQTYDENKNHNTCYNIYEDLDFFGNFEKQDVNSYYNNNDNDKSPDSFSHIYSIKNKYLNKKYTPKTLSDEESEHTRDSVLASDSYNEEFTVVEKKTKKRKTEENSTALKHIYKDMNKIMYTYSD